MRSYILVLLLAMIVIGTAGVSAIQAANTTKAKSAQAIDTQKDVQEPSYVASIKAPQTTEDNEIREAKILANYAKITSKDAENAALAKVSGKVVKTSLDNENGYIVYSIEILTPSGMKKDVKIDAGNGTILHIDNGDHEVGEVSEQGLESD